jgi:hypothetical protein
MITVPPIERVTTKTRKFFLCLFETSTPPLGGPGSSILPVTVDDLCDFVRALPSPDRFRLSVALEEARQAALSAEANEPDAVRFALTEKGRQALEEHQQAKANAE